MSIFNPRQQLARPLGASRAYRDGTLGMTTFGSEVVDPDVQRYQAMMNTSLVKMGFSQIAVDGKLGKGTCGASHLFDSMPESFDTAASNWDDALAMQVHTACDGQAYTVPLLANKTSAYVQGNTDPSCASSAQKLPAGTASPATLAFQNLANTQLAANGYNPITADSKLGPATCGAMKLLDQVASTGYLCQYGGACTSFTLPTKRVSAVVSAPPATPGAQPIVIPTKKPISTASLAMGGVALLAAGGLYYYAKKKGMV